MSPLSAYAAIALIAGAAGSVSGWQIQSWRYAAKDAARIEAQAELDRNNRKAAQSASEGFEHDRTKSEIKFRTITREVEKIVDRPSYRNICFDESGLQLVRAAIRTAADTREPQDALPEP